MKYMGRILGGLIVLFGCLLLAQSPQSEVMPTSGTFKGFYHKYRDGQARFEFFIVPEKFQPKFDPHDGKYIEVEVIKATSQWGRGRGGIIEELGKITVLPQAPVKLQVELHSPVAGQPFTVDVFTMVENTGKKPLTISQGPLITGPNIGKFLCGYSGGETTLAQGQKVPAIAMGWALGRPGPSEIETSISTPLGPAKAWFNVEVDKDGKITPVTKVDGGLTVTAKIVRHEQEYVYFQVTIANTGDASRTVYTRDRQTHNVISNLEDPVPWLPTRIQAFDAKGNEVSVWTGPCAERDGWVERRITAKGIGFSFRLRRENLFAESPIRQVVLHILTDRGLERFEIPVNDDPTIAAVLPDFGPASDGHKIRIRMAKGQFARNEVARWYLEGIDEKGRSDMFWVDKGQLGTSVRILIDGKPLVDDRNHGISEEHVHMFPFQMIMSVVPPTEWKAGTHTVEVIFEGQSGTYTNLNGVQWRKFDKPMRSNTCTFEVR
jgi:hypothetical protein